jgi:hypothetical protein
MFLHLVAGCFARKLRFFAGISMPIRSVHTETISSTASFGGICVISLVNLRHSWRVRDRFLGSIIMHERMSDDAAVSSRHACLPGASNATVAQFQHVLWLRRHDSSTAGVCDITISPRCLPMRSKPVSVVIPLTSPALWDPGSKIWPELFSDFISIFIGSEME